VKIHQGPAVGLGSSTGGDVGEYSPSTRGSWWLVTPSLGGECSPTSPPLGGVELLIGGGAVEVAQLREQCRSVGSTRVASLQGSTVGAGTAVGGRVALASGRIHPVAPRETFEGRQTVAAFQTRNRVAVDLALKFQHQPGDRPVAIRQPGEVEEVTRLLDRPERGLSGGSNFNAVSGSTTNCSARRSRSKR